MRAAAVLLSLAAFAAVPAARAQGGISVRDAGEDGVVLSNLDGEGDPPPALGASRAGRALAPARADRRAQRRQAVAPFVRAAAQAHGLPEALLHAVIEVESGFDAGAVSPKGALGLMQLMPETARMLRVRDARDPAANIDGGARYLKDLLARYGNDLPLALAAYNAGPAAVQRSGGIPRIPETQAYVPRVLSRYRQLLQRPQ